MWSERFICWSIMALLICTPLAFGAVHPWAFIVIESVIFLAIGGWLMAHVWNSGRRSETLPTPLSASVRRLLLPLVLFLGFIFFQLLPLPPLVLHTLSPATYDLYVRTVPGWPNTVPYTHLTHLADLANQDRSGSNRPAVWTVLPTLDEVDKTAADHSGDTLSHQALSDDHNQRTSLSHPLDSSDSPTSTVARWRPLSIAPALTQTGLLKWTAYSAFFFLIWLYPFGRQASSTVGPNSHAAEDAFSRKVFISIVVAGFVIAGLGVLQWATWNGKLLWFFVPYDWGQALTDAVPRATGPFVSHAHFASYLALIFPLAVIGALFWPFEADPSQRKALRLLCAGVVGLVCIAGLLSLSRGGWLAFATASGLMFLGINRLPDSTRRSLLPWSRKRSLTVALGLSGIVLLLALGLIGSAGRAQVDERLAETVLHEATLWFRLTTWQDSLAMIRDFPVFGVGLGGWSELFPHYQRPWSDSVVRHAHNDYLELMAEVGIVGVIFLAWFCLQVLRVFSRNMHRLTRDRALLFVGLLAGLGGLAVHAGFDFSLQIPANALLATAVFGLAMRIAWASETVGHSVSSQQRSSQALRAVHGLPAARMSLRRAFVPGGGLVALTSVTSIMAIIALLVLTLSQERVPYPYNLGTPGSLSEAHRQVLAHPARASSHLSLVRLLAQTDTALPHRLAGLETALWLDPRSSQARDVYAAGLLQVGRVAEGLEEIQRAVFFSPTPSRHVYLQHRLLPWLSEAEQHAIEAGYKQALAQGNRRAAGGLGGLYTAFGRYADMGQLYQALARSEEIATVRADYFVKAGLAWNKAGEREKAELFLRRALALSPHDLRLYEYLATHVFAQAGDLPAARVLIQQGIRSGVDPYGLSVVLAHAAQRAGNAVEVRRALLQALEWRPASFEAHYRLGALYLQANNFSRAALSLRRAVELDPCSASASFALGQAEEGRYHYAEAEAAYRRTVALNPDDKRARDAYASLTRLTSSVRTAGQSGQEGQPRSRAAKDTSADLPIFSVQPRTCAGRVKDV